MAKAEETPITPLHPPPICRLNTDGIYHIHILLSASSILKLRLTCKAFSKFSNASNQFIWTMLVMRDIAPVQQWKREQIPAIVRALKIIPAEGTNSHEHRIYSLFYKARGSKLLGFYRFMDNQPRGGWLRIYLKDNKVYLTMLAKDLDDHPVLSTSLLQDSANNDEGLPFILHCSIQNFKSIQERNFLVDMPISLESLDGGAGLLMRTTTPPRTSIFTSLASRAPSRRRFERLETATDTTPAEVPEMHRDVARLCLKRVFTAVYGPHGQEVVYVLMLHTQAGWILRGRKVVGDPNVPSGEDSFRVHVAEQLLAHEVIGIPEIFSVFRKAGSVVALPSEIGLTPVNFRLQRLPRVVKWFRGFGQINRAPGVWQPELVPILFLIYSPPTTGPDDDLSFSVIWVDDFHVLDYYRYSFGSSDSADINDFIWPS